MSKLFVACGESKKINNVFSEADLARQGGHDGSEVNANAAKTSVKASLPSLHEKSYPSLGLCVPQAILEDFTFAITIINITLYYSATLASMYASSARRAVCIIRGILPLYSENEAETISEGMNSKIFLGALPQTPFVGVLHAHLCAPRTAGNLPCEYLPTPVCKV